MEILVFSMGLSITAYVVRKGSLYTGNNRVGNTISKFPLFKLSLQPGVNTYYFRIEGLAKQFTFTLWDEYSYGDVMVSDVTSLVTTSCILGLCIVSFMVFVATRNFFSILFTVYCFVAWLSSSFLNQSFAITDSFLSRYISQYWIINCGLCATLLQLTPYYIFKEEAQRHSRLIKLLGRWPLLMASIVLIHLLTQGEYSIYVVYSMFVTTFGIAPVVIYLAIKLTFEGYRPAIYYSIGWCSLTLGVTFAALPYMGIIKASSFTQDGIMIGLFLDLIAICFSFAAKIEGERLKRINHLKDLNKELTFRDLKNEKLIGQLKKLIYKHQVFQITQLNRNLEETMPQDKRKAFVISFDIQNSSQLGHTKNHTFFETVLINCNKVMMMNYKPQLLQANAYLIKEMGDGFLCSVGFPFSCDGDPGMRVMNIAESFVEVFSETVLRYFPDEDIYCGVGIAYGEITGYFSKTGLKKYDIFGDAVVHATRYEAMRKHLFSQGVDIGNVIVIQDEAYKNIASEARGELKKFDLNKFRVRDDKNATLLYYKACK